MSAPTGVDAAARIAGLERGFPGFEVGTVASGDTSIGYRVAGDGPTVLLIHGFPESGLEWRTVAPILTQHYRVIVPDYRGAAGSDVPADGYDKTTMAADLHAVVTELGAPAVHVVGHDIGTTLAYAYARQYAADVRSLALIEGVVPGTAMLDAIVAGGAAWHFAFHQQVDLATTLISGREDVYVDYFFDTFLTDPAIVDVADRQFYAEALRRPGAVRAAVSTYAAWFGPDAVDNRAYLEEHGRLSIPTLALGGDKSMGAAMTAIAGDVASTVTPATIEAGHFVTDEAPEDVARILLAHLDAHR
ncbi:MAG: alpha/beta fold hydrolase [Rhodococcus sp. (in: high G+C Gram-positive bacteria)]